MAKKKLEFFTWLRSGLRSISRKHAPIYEALAAAKRPYVGDNPRQKVCYECAKCFKTYAAKEVAVDHRIDCGTLKCWDDVKTFMERLFCSKEGLDVLCHTCHDAKTLAAKKGVSFEEAKLLKEVIAIIKENNVDDIVDFCYSYGYFDCSNAAKRKDNVEAILKEYCL